jgi:Tfp pilus assembly protein PilE
MGCPLSGVDLILLVAGVMLTVVVLSILAQLLYSAYLNRVDRRLASRKGLYRELVSELATLFAVSRRRRSSRRAVTLRLFCGTG